MGTGPAANVAVVRVAYLVARYGAEVVGGAETATRRLAEHLVADAGVTVDVFTTCARESSTWADWYPPGSSHEAGVAVHRFGVRSGRHPEFDALAGRLAADPGGASAADAERFLEWQGPVCPDAVEAATSGGADLLVLYPYLYWPAVAGVAAAGRRSVLHPAAHDEPWLRLPVFAPAVEGAGGLVFQTAGERALVEGRFDVARRPQLLSGLGVDPVGPADPELGRRRLALGDAPFLLCLGRVESGKGTGYLSRFFATYKSRRPGPLRLVLAGPVAERPEPHPDVVVAGVVDEEVKRSLLAGCQVLVQPSYFEAFSLSLLEGWAAQRPALVNAGCAALVEHCRRSGGGLGFDGYARFEAALDRLLADRSLRRRLGRRGGAYVGGGFTWSTVTARYAAFLTAVARRS